MILYDTWENLMYKCIPNAQNTVFLKYSKSFPKTLIVLNTIISIQNVTNIKTGIVLVKKGIKCANEAGILDGFIDDNISFMGVLQYQQVQEICGPTSQNKRGDICDSLRHM